MDQLYVGFTCRNFGPCGVQILKVCEGRGIDFQKYFVSGRMKAVAMSVAMRCKPIHFVLLTDT